MGSTTLPAAAAPVAASGGLRRWLPFLLVLALALAMAAAWDGYWGVIATRAAIYWVLVAGLNLVVGYAGQLAIGYVSLLALGAYTASALVEKAGLPALLALPCAAAMGAACGAIIGLPALRLRTFYFAMTTLGFATIVTQVALAWVPVTGGGMGLPGPELPAPFDTPQGFYLLCLGLAALSTWMTVNVGASRWGRSLVAMRDAEVAAESAGIGKPRLFVTVFLFSGALAGVAGALFATLQSYITPDAFTFDLSVLFFIAILVGGRGSVLGPLLGTVILTLLPEFAAPLVAWSTFLYAVLLLVIVLAVPGGIAALLDFKNRKPLEIDRSVAVRPELLREVLARHREAAPLALRDIHLSFGGVRAIDGLDLELRPGEVHGLIGPNGSGKTTTLNVICGFYVPQQGEARLGGSPLPMGQPQLRAGLGLARTFQTPRIVGESSVLENVMVGGTISGAASFLEAALSLPRSRAEERALRNRALLCLRAVGLEGLAEVRADRLQHSELRFLEIARALMLNPAFLLLDEPAAGLTGEEMWRLGELVRQVAAAGVGVLLVEHHAELIFAVCDRVTVLNLGKELAAGTPAEVRSHKEVVSAYLGG
ncbi:branched-chain amino acid ABC transporter ATP-binding protein/permease [Paracraurococcus lichenis]|uniref:Branched-chain amino acid ABC transporter ATP-binding protein/permease n=1 Tax=Paracraurococcus lichenis TaxID=3064888 RepID=A0ABT9DYM0_9PROT|nr:branched-chain amino acid ABC transporter ATP-binding protein/permease [Paracraurococcus sp. LOR1-02]MDO9708978.1 branched-chain amino acid ABC transporter ATP-binding protein/permease [Paracraurococcus sp. LOR1-02]